MDASYKMKKVGDTEREKLYADQWAKGGPNRRLMKKSAPRAQNAKPHQTAVNRRDATILEGMIERSAGHIVEIPMRTPFPVLQALFAKNLAKRAEKHGMSTASATSLATVDMGSLRRSLFDKR